MPRRSSYLVRPAGPDASTLNDVAKTLWPWIFPPTTGKSVRHGTVERVQGRTPERVLEQQLSQANRALPDRASG